MQVWLAALAVAAACEKSFVFVERLLPPEATIVVGRRAVGRAKVGEVGGAAAELWPAALVGARRCQPRIDGPLAAGWQRAFYVSFQKLAESFGRSTPQCSQLWLRAAMLAAANLCKPPPSPPPLSVHNAA